MTADVSISCTRAASPAYGVCTYHDVLVSYFPGTVTVAALAAVHRANLDLMAKHPRGTVTLGVVGSGIATPSRDVRAYAARIASDASLRIRGECVVVQGHPLWVGMARSALRAIQLLSDGMHPREVCGDVPSAARWVLERSERASGEAEILIDVVRGLVDECDRLRRT